MSLYYFDADLHGTDSIADVLDDIVYIPAPTFTAFSEGVTSILPKLSDRDEVVIDTYTQLLETTRMDGKLGTDNTPLWDKRGKFLEGDKAFLNVYQMAQSFTMRLIRNMRARQARVITVCHEDEVIDQMTGGKTLGPKVNPALVDVLVGQSSDVFRMYEVPNAIMDAEGTVQVKAGARVLYLRKRDSHLAKYNVTRDRSEGVPQFILEPTWEKLSEELGKQPQWLTLYGSPGSGKTTLAVTRKQYN